MRKPCEHPGTWDGRCVYCGQLDPAPEPDDDPCTAPVRIRQDGRPS